MKKLLILLTFRDYKILKSERYLVNTSIFSFNYALLTVCKTSQCLQKHLKSAFVLLTNFNY